MAFTEQEEQVLKGLIPKIQEGKKISDLPVAQNPNPYDLWMEAITNMDDPNQRESKRVNIADSIPYYEEQVVYGIEIDVTEGSPLKTRIGNSDLHQSLPLQSMMKGVFLNDDGEEVQDLSPTDWTIHDRSGALGQVMVKLPEYWARFDTEGVKLRVNMSAYPFRGAIKIPSYYMSAYEASQQRSTGKLCSVVNTGADFRGGNNQDAWDGTHRSVLGRPVTQKSRTQFRTAARLRGTNNDPRWNLLDYNADVSYFWLYFVEYANLNSQAPFNAAKDAAGYAQGGLGNGVTTLASADWNTFNGFYPFIPCGYTDSLGNGSGEIAYNVDVNGDQSKMVTVMVPRYRGIENPFGHIWKWTDGINIDVKTDADGGTSQVYVSENPSAYNDTNMTDYTHRGNCARVSGYVKQIIFGSKGDIIPKTVGGGSTTYWCDYSDANITVSSLRGLFLGGTAYNGASAGFACSHTYYAPSTAGTYIGSRLCFIPSAT